MIRKEFLSTAASLAMVLLAGLLTICVIAGAVILDPHTYKRAAREDAYLRSIEKNVTAELEKAARQTGLPEKLLKKHASPQTIEELAKQSAADAALVLKGRQVIYSSSFDKNALLADMNQYYKEELGIPAEGTRQELLNDTAAGIQNAINTTVRVVDMAQIASDPALSETLSVLTFIGQGGILLTLLLMAVLLLFLYQRTGRDQFPYHLWGIGLSAGICHLMAAGLFLSAGFFHLTLDSETHALLWQSMARGALAALLLTAVFWLLLAFLSLRGALGKTILPHKLRSRIARWHEQKKTTDETAPSADVSTSETDAPYANGANATSNQELVDIIRKAAADSLNTLLWRRRK